MLWALAMYSRLLERGSALRLTRAPGRSVQSGYALMSLTQILWLNFAATNLEPGKDYGKTRMPPGQMDPALSVVKDVVYGVLDSVTKGGLALFAR